jgi:hypothetical protein
LRRLFCCDGTRTAVDRDSQEEGLLIAEAFYEVQEEDAEVRQLLLDVGQRRLCRRDVLCRGIRLGLAIPVIGWLLTVLEEDEPALA